MKSFQFVFAFLFLASACAEAQQPASAIPSAPVYPAMPALPVPPGMSSAAPLEFGVAGLVVSLRNDYEPRGRGAEEPTLMGEITIDGIPVPPSPLYGRLGGLIPLGHADNVAVRACLTPRRCEHVVRGRMWYAFETVVAGRTVLMRGPEIACFEKKFGGRSRIVSVDRWHEAACPAILN